LGFSFCEPFVSKNPLRSICLPATTSDDDVRCQIFDNKRHQVAAIRPVAGKHSFPSHHATFFAPARRLRARTRERPAVAIFSRRAIDRVPRGHGIGRHPERRSAPASLIVNREPDGRHRVVGPRHAMTHMGVDVNVAAGFKQKGLALAFEDQAG
jgi:hypothetical protein